MDSYGMNPAFGLNIPRNRAGDIDPYEDLPIPPEEQPDHFTHFEPSDFRSITQLHDEDLEYRPRDRHTQQGYLRQSSFLAPHNYDDPWERRRSSESHLGRSGGPLPPYSWEHWEQQELSNAPPNFDYPPPSPFSPPHARRRRRSPVRQSTPSQEYLIHANRPSTSIHDPTSSRKLLILDLNGSLLVRARWSGTEPAEPGQRLVRKVHRRPYLQSFQDYIFHPKTRTWLDTMIWSSAQPHSVHDMVDKCFGRAQENFAAIWARDTLGLKHYEYHQKTQTTKDLAIPWRKLQLNPGYGGKPHSASTTLLVDDSPLKARLQPYNHMAIREYDADTLRRDRLAVLKDAVRSKARRGVDAHGNDDRRERQHEGETGAPSTAKRKRSADDEGDEEANSSEDEDEPEPEPAPESEQPDDPSGAPGFSGPPLSKKQRKELARKERKRRKRERRMVSANSQKGPKKTNAPSSSPPPPPSPIDAPVAGVDATLLAVVGVLDAIKREDNIAGWMRQGALWAGRPAQRTAAASAQDDPTVGSSTPSDASNHPPQILDHIQDSTDVPMADDDEGTTDTRAEPSGAPTEVSDVAPPEKGLDACEHIAAADAGGNEGQLEQLDGDDSLVSVLERRPSNIPCDPPVNDKGADADLPAQATGADAGDTDSADVPLWFESEEVMAHWVDRGVKALAELGIPLVHGVEREA
ncbi:hypothetical protein K523DRAFT_314651 [Schizophyllum commune Tattone D]|nr:hypothetical protein K523DRAFT_314651 [Schizophyllum commune Tattone D]